VPWLGTIPGVDYILAGIGFGTLLAPGIGTHLHLIGFNVWMHTALGAVAGIPWNPAATEEPLLLATHLERPRIWRAHQYRTLLWSRLQPGRVFSLVSRFRLQRQPLAGWSSIAAQVALTYAATVIGLAAHQAGRPDLIRSPKRVLACSPTPGRP
jgi:hypothetical protein